ncbi:MAG: hypothetical protein JKY67_23335, partial [Pseudomonadales bacterium]|nr:hypothetical protein [Pseudomonadales bacterium]
MSDDLRYDGRSRPGLALLDGPRPGRLLARSGASRGIASPRPLKRAVSQRDCRRQRASGIDRRDRLARDQATAGTRERDLPWVGL